jgi:hypothetical protein
VAGATFLQRIPEKRKPHRGSAHFIAANFSGRRQKEKAATSSGFL